MIRAPLSLMFAAVTALAAAPACAQDAGLSCPAEVGDDPTRSQACEILGRATVVVEASVETDPVEVRLRITTSSGERLVRVGAARRARHQAGLEVVDFVRVRLAAVDGISDVALVTVTAFVAGEDDSWYDQTLVVVALRGRPRVLWLGSGDYERSRMGVCTITRTTDLAVVGGTLRVRSRVSAALAADAEPSLRALLSAACVAPRATRADIPLR
jgi:hypothetical protein